MGGKCYVETPAKIIFKCRYHLARAKGDRWGLGILQSKMRNGGKTLRTIAVAHLSLNCYMARLVKSNLMLPPAGFLFLCSLTASYNQIHVCKLLGLSAILALPFI